MSLTRNAGPEGAAPAVDTATANAASAAATNDALPCMAFPPTTPPGVPRRSVREKEANRVRRAQVKPTLKIVLRGRVSMHAKRQRSCAAALAHAQYHPGFARCWALKRRKISPPRHQVGRTTQRHEENRSNL